MPLNRKACARKPNEYSRTPGMLRSKTAAGSVADHAASRCDTPATPLVLASAVCAAMAALPAAGAPAAATGASRVTSATSNTMPTSRSDR